MRTLLLACAVVVPMAIGLAVAVRAQGEALEARRRLVSELSIVSARANRVEQAALRIAVERGQAPSALSMMEQAAAGALPGAEREAWSVVTQCVRDPTCSVPSRELLRPLQELYVAELAPAWRAVEEAERVARIRVRAGGAVALVLPLLAIFLLRRRRSPAQALSVEPLAALAREVRSSLEHLSSSTPASAPLQAEVAALARHLEQLAHLDGRQSPVPVSVRRLVADTIEACRERARAQDVMLVSAVEPASLTVGASEAPVGCALRVLLAEALATAARGSSICVTANRFEAVVRLSVERAAPWPQQLALRLVRDLVEHQGGQVQLSPDHLCAYITLPVAPPKCPPDKAAA